MAKAGEWDWEQVGYSTAARSRRLAMKRSIDHCFKSNSSLTAPNALAAYPDSSSSPDHAYTCATPDSVESPVPPCQPSLTPQDDLPPPKSRRPSSAGTGAEPSKEKARASSRPSTRSSIDSSGPAPRPSPHEARLLPIPTEPLRPPNRKHASKSASTRRNPSWTRPFPSRSPPHAVVPPPTTTPIPPSTTPPPAALPVSAQASCVRTDASPPAGTWNKDRPRPHTIDIAAISSHAQAEELIQRAQRSVVELAHAPAPAFGAMLRGELRAGEVVEGGERREAGERGSGVRAGGGDAVWDEAAVDERFLTPPKHTVLASRV
ncbi:hypothetical protein OF83DRAFT_1288046 [Amylostereum chailletii]|nr:hypothetical protein OF83DRAFT_1288046 [Amylostereum chailletii]